MAAPTSDLDFYGAETLADPIAAYEQLLALGPVVWLEPQQKHAIVGFDAVTEALRDHRRFSSAEGVSLDEGFNAFLKGSTLNSDPPAHDATRAITFAPLTPKALAQVRARVEAEARVVADRVASGAPFDAAREVAPHIPLAVVRDLVGLGDGGHAHMLDWGAATFELMGDPRDRRDTALDRLRAMRAFLDDPEVLNGLAPDGWAKRATDRGLAEGRDYDAAIKLMRDYIAPSLDTTISAISYGLHLFASHPDQWDALRADPSLLKNAIEEIVRLAAPIRSFSRVVTADTELAGTALGAGERVIVVYGSANRDPARFADPARFDITRNTRGHVGFGHGVHTCLGMHLARLEMTCLFEALLARVSRFELRGAPEMAQNASIHAFASVPMQAVS